MTAHVLLATLAAGALGALIRYGISARAAASSSPARALPWAVLLVNVIGSLVGGAAFAAAELLGLADLRMIVLVGFAGGLTTFSTFSVETIQLVLSGHTRRAALSVSANLAGGIGAAVAGWAVVTAIVAVARLG